MRLLPLAFLWLSATSQAQIQNQDDWKNVIMDMGLGCRVKVSVPMEARVGFGKENGGSGGIQISNPPRATKLPYEDSLTLKFNCLDFNLRSLLHGKPIRFDAREGKWSKDMQNFFAAQVWGKELTPEKKKLYTDAVIFYEIQNVDGKGFAFTEDDLIGDEDKRERRLYFCMPRQEKTICGDSIVGWLPLLKKNKKNDLGPFAVRILNSIEFLPEPPLPSQPAPATQKAISR